MTNPYPAFNFSLATGTAPSPEPLGGFSEVNGLTPSPSPGNVTLKRGIVNSADFIGWLAAVRASPSTAGRTAFITSYGENNTPQQACRLADAIPKRFLAGDLSPKGEADVAVEELVLSCTRIDSVPSR